MNVRLLIYDDPRTLAEALLKTLNDQGIAVEAKVTTDTDEFIDLLDSHNPHIVILSRSSVSFDALNLLAVLKRRKNSLPVVFLYNDTDEFLSVRLPLGDLIPREELIKCGAMISEFLEELEFRGRLLLSEERKGVQDRLEKISQSIQFHPGLYFVHNFSGNIIAANDCSGVRLPFLTDDFTGKTFEEILPADISAKLMQQKKDTAGGSEQTQSILSFAEANEQLHFEVTMYPLKSGEMVTLINDITERFEEEQKTIRRLQLFDYLAEAVIGMDKDLTVFHWNKGAQELFHLGEQWVLGKNVSDIFGTVIPEKDYGTIYDDVIQTGTSVTEYAYSVDGMLKILVSKVQPIRNDAGDMTGVVETIQDITKLRQVEANAKRNTELFQNLLDHLPHPVAVFQKFPQLSYGNLAFFKLTGLGRDAVAFTKIDSLFDPADVLSVKEKLMPLIDGDMQQTEFETTMIKKNSVTRTAVKVSARRLQINEASGLFLSIVDVTEYKIALEGVKDQARTLEHKATAEKVYSVGLQHNIRSSMNAVLGFADILREEFRSFKDQSFYQFAEHIFDNGSTLLKMIEQYPDIENVDLMAADLKMTETMLPVMLSHILSEKSKKSEQRSIKMLLANRARVEAITDQQKLSAVVSFLMDEIIKFSQDFTVYIEPGYDQIRDMSFVRIKTTLAWIETKNLNLLTAAEPDEDSSPPAFTTEMNYERCYKMVRLMNGRFEITSMQEAGTTLTIYLPAPESVKSDLTAQPTLFMTGSPEMYYLNQLRPFILIVEDDPGCRKMLELTLRSVAKLDFAQDGKEALDAIDAQYKYGRLYDLVLCDIGLPLPYDGFLVREEIVKRWAEYRNIPIVAETAYALQRDQRKILDAGFDGFISKPIDRRFLIKTLVSILKKVRGEV